MDIHNLYLFNEIIKYGGYSLSVNQIPLIENSLLELQAEHYYRKMFFLGTVFGIHNDYFIAFATNDDIVEQRFNYFRY